MKILQLANKFPYPAKDGGSIATLSLSRSLAGLGHQVTLLAMNTSKHFTDTTRIPETLTSIIRFIPVPVDTSISLTALIRNFLFSKLPYNAQRFIDREFEKELDKLLGSETFDVIILEGLYLAPYLPVLRKLSAAPVAMRAHNIEHEIWERSSLQEKGLKRWYFRHLAGRIKKMETGYLNSYDLLLPITGRDGDRLTDLGCRLPVHVLPTGIDIDTIKPSFESIDPKAVFHIGALDWTPNLEGLSWFLERVWPLVHSKNKQAGFYIAGRNASQSLIKTFEKPGVDFIGEIDDAYSFMASKGIMVVPLLSGSGMRIKIIEGMALGKAIVTTSIGTEGISTRHGENILVADNPKEFAAFINQLLENKHEIMRLGENARKFVSDNYDNLVITSELVRFFENHTGWQQK